MKGNGGQKIVVRKIGILLLFNRYQVNYINPILNPGTVSLQPSPESGALGTSIEDPTLENSLLSFNRIHAHE